VNQNNWQLRVARLNYAYLSLLKEAGLRGDGIAQKVLGVGPEVVQVLQEADDTVLQCLAQVGTTFFKLHVEQLDRAISLTNEGTECCARTLLVMRTISEEEAGG